MKEEYEEKRDGLKGEEEKEREIKKKKRKCSIGRKV